MPIVLFVCVHNATRSQMAEAFLRARAGGRAVARSAGSDPGPRVNPVAVTAMAERGIDLSKARPKRIADAGDGPADVVVTMGCGDACPVAPGATREDWPLEDPAGRELAMVRRVRDEIEARVADLCRRLGIEGGPAPRP